jgi:hypothetical protein
MGHEFGILVDDDDDSTNEGKKKGLTDGLIMILVLYSKGKEETFFTFGVGGV